jgi:hypothetical protein
MIEPTIEAQREAEAALYSSPSVNVVLSDKDEADVTEVQTFFFKDEWMSLAQDARSGLNVVVLSPAQAYALWFALNARYS